MSARPAALQGVILAAAQAFCHLAQGLASCNGDGIMLRGYQMSTVAPTERWLKFPSSYDDRPAIVVISLSYAAELVCSPTELPAVVAVK